MPLTRSLLPLALHACQAPGIQAHFCFGRPRVSVVCPKKPRSPPVRGRLLWILTATSCSAGDATELFLRLNCDSRVLIGYLSLSDPSAFDSAVFSAASLVLEFVLQLFCCCLADWSTWANRASKSFAFASAVFGQLRSSLNHPLSCPRPSAAPLLYLSAFTCLTGTSAPSLHHPCLLLQHGLQLLCSLFSARTLAVPVTATLLLADSFNAFTSCSARALAFSSLPIVY